MIFALLGALVGCGVLVLMVVVFIALMVSKQRSDATAAEIATGSAGGLEDWTGSTLAELSRHLVGTWYYQRPMGGKGISRMTAGVHSTRSRGEVLRFSAEKDREGVPRRGSWTDRAKRAHAGAPRAPHRRGGGPLSAALWTALAT